MPPLFFERTEAVLHHDLPQHHTHRILFFRDFRIVRVAELTEIIKGSAHIDFPLRVHVKQRQIHRAAPAVAGMLRNIPLREEDGLIQFRVEVFLHAGILRIQRPVHKVRDCHLRAVSIEDLQPVALTHQLIADLFQRGGSLCRQHGQRLFVSVDAVSYKIVGGIVTDLQNGIRYRLAQEHKVGGVIREHDVRLLLREPRRSAGGHVFLQIRKEEHIVIQVVCSFRENIQPRRIIRRIHVRHDQFAAIADIGAAELRNRFRIGLHYCSQVKRPVGHGAVGLPVQGIDGQRFHPGRDNDRLRHIAVLTVKADDGPDICLSGRRYDLGISLRRFFCKAPADGINRNQPVAKSRRFFALSAVVLLQKFLAHLSALGEPGENDPSAVVFMIQIPAERGGNVFISGLSGLLPFCLREIICVDRHLPVIWRKQTPRILVDPFFQIEGIEEVPLEFVIEIKGVGLAFCIHSRTDQENIDLLIPSFFKICPVIRQAVIRRSIQAAFLILLGGPCDPVCVDPGKVIFHGDRNESFCRIIRRFLLPVLCAPFPDIVIRNDHIRLRRIRIPAVDRIIHHAGVASAVPEREHRPLSDLSFHINGFVAVQVFLDKAACNDQFIAVFIFEVHVRRDILTARLLDFKIRADHMIGRDVIPVRGVRDNGPGRSALRAADHINRKVIFIQVLYKLYHRKIGVVNVPHVLKARGIFLPELDRVLVEFLHCHTGIRFGKVPCQILICRVSGFNGCRDLF